MRTFKLTLSTAADRAEYQHRDLPRNARVLGTFCSGPETIDVHYETPDEDGPTLDTAAFHVMNECDSHALQPGGWRGDCRERQGNALDHQGSAINRATVFHVYRRV